ncbi:MAG: GNAT family N-acetyltransferase [Roseburia sp.]
MQCVDMCSQQDPFREWQRGDGGSVAQAVSLPEPQEWMMLAMTRQQEDFALEHHMPVVGLELSGQEHLTRVNMVLWGLEDVDVEFMIQQYQRCMGIPWEILRTERCVVRELELSDLDELFALYAKPHVTDFVEPLYEYQEERKYQQEYISRIYGYYGYGMWLVFHRQTGELIGRAGVEQRIVGEETELELGYLIAPEYWHQGYGSEVCRAILAWVQEHLDFRRVESMVEPGNTASIRLLERLGFSYVGPAVRDGKEFRHYRMDFHS